MDVNHHTCVQCSKEYSNISNLRKHVKTFHPDEADYLASLQLRKNKQYNFTCDQCDKRFMHLKHLRYHAKTHGCSNEITPDITDTPKTNKCALCNNFSADKKTIIEHYRQFHNIPIEHKKLEFQSEEEFITWKLTFENDTNTKFVVDSRKCCKSHISTDFVCHRSGRYVPEGKNIRRLKFLGSNKINALCPASIKLKKLNSGTCEVITIEQHVGHTNDIGHLNLSKIERENLAVKIASQVRVEDILEEIRDSITDSEPKRLHLLTKKDLYNITSKLTSESTSSKLTTASFASKKQRVASLLEELQHTVCCSTSEEELDVIEKALVPIKHKLPFLNNEHTEIIEPKTCKNKPQKKAGFRKMPKLQKAPSQETALSLIV